MASKVFRLVVFQEDGAWVSQCVDYDLNGQGSSVPEAIESIKRVIVTQAILDEREGLEPFSRNRPAPERFVTMFEHGSMLRKQVAVQAARVQVQADAAVFT